MCIELYIYVVNMCIYMHTFMFIHAAAVDDPVWGGLPAPG